MTTLVNDTFTGTDGTNCDGRTPSPTTAGNNWAKYGTSTGAWSIQGNACQQTTIPAPLSDYQLAVDCGVADCTYTVDQTVTTTWNGGIIANFVDTNNFWLFDIPSTGATQYDLYERVSGTDTKRATTGSSPIAGSTTLNLKIVTNGDTITCFVGGSQVLTYNIANRSSKTAKLFGFRQANVSSIFSRPKWDNFLIDGVAPSTAYNDPLWFGMTA